MLLLVPPGVDMLHDAVAERRRSGASRIHLLPGVHRLTHALELNHLDSGMQFFGDATISGGVPITGWSPLSGNADVLSAAAPPGAQDRHLYVGGERARRPRMAEADAAAGSASSLCTRRARRLGRNRGAPSRRRMRRA